MLHLQNQIHRFSLIAFVTCMIFPLAFIGTSDILQLRSDSKTIEDFIIGYPVRRRAFKESSWLTGERQRTLEDYLQEAAPFLKGLRPHWNGLMFQLTGKTTPKVLASRNGWLYVADAYESPYIGREFDYSIQRIVEIRDRLRQAGIEMILCIPPNKGHLYPAHLPERLYYRDIDLSHYRRFMKMLREADVRVADLGELFTEHLKRYSSSALYYMADNHWTSQGSELAAVEIARMVNREELLPFHGDRIRFKLNFWRHDGVLRKVLPLTQFLGINHASPALEPLAQAYPTWAYSPYDPDYLEELAPPIYVELVGTSFSVGENSRFSNHLRYHIGCLIETEFSKDGGGIQTINNLDKILAKADKPDLLIWEFPELYLAGRFFEDLDLFPRPLDLSVWTEAEKIAAGPRSIQTHGTNEISFTSTEDTDATIQIKGGEPSAIEIRPPDSTWKIDGTCAIEFEMMTPTNAQFLRGRLRINTGAGFPYPIYQNFKIEHGEGWHQYILPLQQSDSLRPNVYSIRIEPPPLAEGESLQIRNLQWVRTNSEQDRGQGRNLTDQYPSNWNSSGPA